MHLSLLSQAWQYQSTSRSRDGNDAVKPLPTLPGNTELMRQQLRLFSRLPLVCRGPLSRAALPIHRLSFPLKIVEAPLSRYTKARTFASVMTQVHRVTDDLEKPALDDRSYRVITLPNKLEVLLVHDSDTDKASASLNVNVGSLSDDDQLPGLAHAVEHFLFMGTQKVHKSRCMPYLEDLRLIGGDLEETSASLRSTKHFTDSVISIQ